MCPKPWGPGPRPDNILPWGWTQLQGRAGPGVRRESRSRGEKGAGPGVGREKVQTRRGQVTEVSVCVVTSPQVQGTEEQGARDHKCQTSNVKVQGAPGERAGLPEGQESQGRGSVSRGKGFLEAEFPEDRDRGGVTRCQLPAARSLPVSGAAASMPAVAANSGLYL